VLADDPIFGRFCFGGDWRKTSKGIEVIPKDGLRRRFHAMLDNGELHLVLDNDRFASDRPIVLDERFSGIHFQLESDNPPKHVAKISLSGLPGDYTVRNSKDQVAQFKLKEREQVTVELPVENTRLESFNILKDR
jgi:hypothetical protein